MNLDELFEANKETKHEVLSSEKKIEIVYERLLEEISKNKNLDNRLKRLEVQLKLVGCSIINSVSSEFEVRNKKAKELENILEKLENLPGVIDFLDDNIDG